MDIHNPSVCDELPGKNCIKCTCDNCSVQKYQEQVMKENITLIRALQRVSWQQWGDVKYIGRDSNRKKKTALITYYGSVAKLLALYFKQLKMIAMHQFQKLWQLQNFNMTLRYSQHGQVLFVHDFQMNLMLFTQDEPAGTHWDHPQITIHPTSAFFHCLNTKCNKIVCEDIIHISDVLRHDKHAVNTFVMKSIDHLKGKGVPIQEIIEFTDQTSGQYKSKFTFYTITKFDVPYTRHFYGVKHGKSPSDRSGGQFKKSMRNAVKSKEVPLNARQIEDYCHREYFQQNACKEHNKMIKSDNSSDELCNKFSGDKQDPHIQCIVYDHAVIERQPDECIKGISGSRDWIHMVQNTGVEGVVQHKFFDCCCFGCIMHSAPCSQGNYSDTWITASIKGKHDLNNINAEE